MDQNYTPLDSEKINPPKKSFKIPNKVLIGMIVFFVIGIGTIGFLLTRQTIQTGVPAQVGTQVTETPTPTPTQTSQVTVTVAVTPVETETPIPSATIEISPTAEPTTEPTLTESPSLAPTDSSPTPTEIVLAQAISVTSPPQVPSAGVATYSKILLTIGVIVVLLGFIF